MASALASAPFSILFLGSFKGNLKGKRMKIIEFSKGTHSNFKFQLVDPITNSPVAVPKLMLKIFGPGPQAP